MKEDSSMLQPPKPPGPWQRARALILRWLISTLAIFVAVYLLPGIEFVGPGWELGIVALVFGLVNAVLRPLLTMLTCPLIILTLGLFGLVITIVSLALSLLAGEVPVHVAVRRGSGER